MRPERKAPRRLVALLDALRAKRIRSYLASSRCDETYASRSTRRICVLSAAQNLRRVFGLPLRTFSCNKTIKFLSFQLSNC